MIRTVLIAATFVALASPAVTQEGDPAEGASVFRRCQPCHNGDKETNKVGPHLVGVVGRPAASLPDFSYSKAMREAGAGGLVWDEATLAKYLVAPKALVPGTSMAFAGIKNEEQLADLIAWLKADPKP